MVDRKTIMVVEDEEDAAEMFGEMMRVSGYDVVVAFGSKAALKAMEEKPPDAVILDIMMPEVSGLELLQSMRRNRRLAAVPVVVVSAKGTLPDVKAALEAGATLYLKKPVGFSELRDAVEKVMAVS